MSLKILHSADWHLDSPFASFSPEQRRFLRCQQRKLPGRLGELIHREGVQLVLLAGDLFDGPATRETLDLVKQELGRWGIPVFISPGNHDFCGPDSPWEGDWPENVHIFTGEMTFVALPGLDCRVYGAGYSSMDCPPLLEDFHAEGEERWCVAVLHGDPMVRSSPCCPVTASQVRESGLDYLALGHIHRAGSFRAGQTLCAWPGCPMGRGWDETGEKGVFLVTLEEGAAVDQQVLDLPRFYDLQVPVGADAARALEQVLPPGGSSHFWRITLTGDGPVDLQRLQPPREAYPNLQLRDRTEEPVHLWESAGQDSLRGVYFDLLRQSQDPNAALAAEISQKLLLGREVVLP